jgi:DNA-binding transcriptional MerR regulator
VKSTELVEFAGISYRQLDNWVAADYILTATGKHPGHGKARVFEEKEAEVAKRIRLLMAAGFTTPTAGKVARESLNNRTVSLRGPAYGLVLTHGWYSS